MAWYVFRYYPQLMNEHERAANRHLTGTIKATKGRSDAEAQAKARSGPRPLHDLLSDEPQVLCLAANGYQSFVMRKAELTVNDTCDDDLSIKNSALLLRNPLHAANEIFGYSFEFAHQVDLNRLVGLVSKGLSREHIEGAPAPRLYTTPSGMLYAVGLQNVGVPAFV